MPFRIRLLTTSILIVATVLTLVMLLSWSRIIQFEVERLDTRLCIEAKRIATIQSEEPQSTGLSDYLGVKLRVNASQHLLLLVKNNRDQINSKVNWPQNFSFAASLNWSDANPVPKTFSPKKGSQPPRKQKIETCQFAQFEKDGRQWRAVLYTPSGIKSFIAVDFTTTKSELQSSVQSALIVVIPIALLLCILSAWLIAGITMRPLNRLSDAMKAVTQKDFHHRLPESSEDTEFKLLINTYNMMLERLERSFQQASRFSADAAHELKTPLTILRGQLEQAVSQADPQQLDLNSVLDEVGKLSGITRKLLLLSQADAGSLALHYARIDLTTLLDELLADLEFLPEKPIVNCDIAKELSFNGDIILLRQLINNLVSNAIRYHQPDTAITINAQRNRDSIEIIFSNQCAPISTNSRQHLFDRFFRGDPAHNRSTEGNGLGLSLAREIAKAHGGSLQLDKTSEDRVTLRLNLPD